VSSKYLPLLEETFLKICGSKISINFSISNIEKPPAIETNHSEDISAIEKVEEKIL